MRPPLQFNDRVALGSCNRPLLKGYSIEYSTFANGNFGNLERIELESFNKLATVEFWSEGWVGIDIYDCACDEQMMNILLSPEEKDLVPKTLEKLLDILSLNS